MQFTKFNNNGQVDSQGVRVIALDKRTGAARFRRDVSPNGQFHSLTSDARKGEIDFLRNDLRIRFSPEGSQVSANTPPVAPVFPLDREVIAQPVVPPVILRKR